MTRAETLHAPGADGLGNPPEDSSQEPRLHDCTRTGSEADDAGRHWCPPPRLQDACVQPSSYREPSLGSGYF